MRKIIAAVALLLAATAASGLAYPTKPIRFIVPSPPGGSPDILARIAWVANVATVNVKLGVNSVADLVKLAKEKPDQLNYGSAGNGSPAHMAGAMFDVLAGVKTVHVPYKGAVQAMIKNGATPNPETPAAFAAFIRSEQTRMPRISKQANITLD